MSMRFLLPALLGLSLSACTQVTRITEISDLPLKSTGLPAMDWEQSPLRANAQYVLFDAHSHKQKYERIGDYFFFNWYDAQPEKPVKIVMLYTQARTASELQKRVIEYKEPRKSAGFRKDRLFFIGPQRRKDGDVLSWRMELYCDGVLMDARNSYLWK